MSLFNFSKFFFKNFLGNLIKSQNIERFLKVFEFVQATKPSGKQFFKIEKFTLDLERCV